MIRMALIWMLMTLVAMVASLIIAIHDVPTWRWLLFWAVVGIGIGCVEDVVKWALKGEKHD